MGDKTKNTPDQVRSEAGELDVDDLVRISRRVIDVLEEEHCTVAQVSTIVEFVERAASEFTLVKVITD